MIRHVPWIFCLLPLLGAQTGPVLAGIGYAPTHSTIAPGQIVTLHVTGLKTVLSAPVTASITPLPLSLSGISVTLNQLYHNSVTPYALPMISLTQRVLCSGNSAAPDCFETLITVQVPFELPVLFSQDYSMNELAISENGVSSKAFAVQTAVDNPHVLTTCGTSGSAVCATHSDGTLISAASPARAGETIVIYAWGLGAITPPVASGQATPASAPKLSLGVLVQFDFRPNAGPAFPFERPSSAAVAFAGLTAGQVGLYQVNVQLPEVFPAVPACVGTSVYEVRSNLTVNISTPYYSFDAAPVCVQPMEP